MLCDQGYVLHICCGPQGVGGEGEKGTAEAVGKGKDHRDRSGEVLEGGPGVARRRPAPPRKSTRAIAVILPNNQDVELDWSKYRVSVRDVEQLTGYTFFRDLPAATAEAIKQDVDQVRVAVPKSKKGRS